ncbi:glutamate:protein symporter [Terribacillus saccharophilus]|jgi:proton glutamate symport protein|uniref:Glutamate:protein symporter n=1 Tax=Terribacillus saccharophilus TaxID=361277 RepID=A0A268HGR6_9BACI|nr:MULTISPECIES: cation:dicarboxylase symporter family transporter [Terribacillus]PAD36200.1 glutamate:protein symporter [Terribacillus saccharophilus]PAD96719.1 glutamate:protein symporter [Terribacillus saccharophilus]PAE00295.1 glutamate:protein symporter [Terribacillus saccharophilus]PAE09040.1 glutamate:protein symporter [Terribacillus saccharophilus]VVM33490.1 Proton/glutamate symport protein @ Sodium/glutamate symport protein [Terribacillus sp. AE2B 122]
MKRFKIGLAYQILIGLVLGIIVGAIFYGSDTAVSVLQPFGDLFLRAIKMIVVPIVISSIIVGVAGVGDIKQVGKLGFKTILYFEIVTTIALIVGLAFGNIFQPGEGIDRSALETTSISQYEETAETQEDHSVVDTFLEIIPTNVFQAMTEGDMLAIVFFSVIFGVGVAAIGQRGQPVLSFFQGVSEAMFWVTNLVMKLAPIGVFGLIGVTVAQFGLQSLIPLGKLAIVTYGSMLFFVIVVFAIIAKICGVNLFKMLRMLKDELLLSFSTASSETVLPKIMEKMERLGAPKAITSFVVPTGYTFNLDGSTLYQALATLFIAQMYGIDMSIWDQLLVLGVLIVTSKGIAAVPGASFVVLLATLSAVGLPAEGLAFIAGIDRILDMGRTAVNVVGNSLAVIVISKWEGKFKLNKDVLEQKAG